MYASTDLLDNDGRARGCASARAGVGVGAGAGADPCASLQQLREFLQERWDTGTALVFDCTWYQ